MISQFYGYHKDCGGAVREHTDKKGYSYSRCNRCQTCNVNKVDIVEESFKILHQKTCGIRKKAKKYDYTNWNEIK